MHLTTLLMFVEICEILLKMPARSEGKSRIEKLMFDLDKGIRNKYYE
jgi:hypothetical protein